jgi:hypothetical protein
MGFNWLKLGFVSELVNTVWTHSFPLWCMNLTLLLVKAECWFLSSIVVLVSLKLVKEECALRS